MRAGAVELIQQLGVDRGRHGRIGIRSDMADHEDRPGCFGRLGDHDLAASGRLSRRTSAKSWLGLKGLVRNKLAPEVSASWRANSWPRAVSMITGMFWVAAFCFNSLRAPRPSSSGMLMSRMIKSGN